MSTAYDPLPSASATRVVVIHPGARHEPLTASLSVIDISNDSDFEAVSYTWGPSDESETLLLDNHVVQIRRNLHDCLLELRNIYQIRRLWIDALSISQSDIAEKNQQVRMIGRIFSRAQRVVAWLGNHQDDSDIVFDIIARLWKEVQRSRLTRRIRSYADKHEDYIDTLMGMETPCVDRCVRANLALMRRQYFARTWVIQEVTLARTVAVRCGDREIPWDAFCVWEKCVTHDRYATMRKPEYEQEWDAAKTDNECAVEDIDMLDRARKDHNSAGILPKSIIDLVCAARTSKCAVALDRVYALRALEKLQFWHEPVPVNYGCSPANLFLWICAQRLITYKILCHWHQKYQLNGEYLLPNSTYKMQMVLDALGLHGGPASAIMRFARSKLCSASVPISETHLPPESKPAQRKSGQMSSGMQCSMRDWWDIFTRMFVAAAESRGTHGKGHALRRRQPWNMGISSVMNVEQYWEYDNDRLMGRLDLLEAFERDRALFDMDVDGNMDILDTDKVSIIGLEDPPMPRWWGEHGEAKTIRQRLDDEVALEEESYLDTLAIRTAHQPRVRLL